MSKTRKYFGTDGVRGMVGEYPITPEFALKLVGLQDEFIKDWHQKSDHW